MTTGIVFDIKRYAIHDGPGIRTTVFLKGCPLNCLWCHNPEGIDPAVHILLRPERCIGCGACVAACDHHALTRTATGIVHDPQRCRRCGRCAAVCPAEAREQVGRVMTVDQVVHTVLRDRPFFEESGGGVTFSGGEPLMQARFLEAALQQLGAHGIHRVVDTSGLAAPQAVDAVAPLTDLFLYDVKLMDRDRHRHCTGATNDVILANLRRLSAAGAAIVVRVPMIAGLSATSANIAALGDFLAGLAGIRRVDLLTYHTGARSKYKRFGRTYRAAHLTAPRPADLHAAAQRLAACGLPVHIEGEENHDAPHSASA